MASEQQFALKLPTEKAMKELQRMANDHGDKDVRLLAEVVACLAESIETIAGALDGATIRKS